MEKTIRFSMRKGPVHKASLGGPESNSQTAQKLSAHVHDVKKMIRGILFNETDVESNRNDSNTTDRTIKSTKKIVELLFALSHATELVETCEKPDDFRTLFSLLGIPGEKWRSSGWLEENGFRPLYRAILRDNRFGTWDAFCKFIGDPAKITIHDEGFTELPYGQQIEGCKKPDDFRTLFSLLGIPGEKWRSSGWLEENGFRPLYRAILRDNRFGTWDAFCKFIGDPAKITIHDEGFTELPYGQQIEGCKKPDDFRTLFSLLGIPGEKWRSSGWLEENGFRRLYRAILRDNRFGKNWQFFCNWMDKLTKTEEEIDEQMSSLNIEDAFALLGPHPGKLRAFLSISHPELLPKEIDQLVRHSFKNIHNKRIYNYDDFQEVLHPCTVSEYPKRTTDAAGAISGMVSDADTVLIEGNISTRRVKVDADGKFSARIPLSVGTRNTLKFIPLNHEKKQLGPVVQVIVHQTGRPDDIEALVQLLDQMGKDVLENTRTDPGRHEYVVRQAEQVLIRKFSGSFTKGKAYIEHLLTDAKSPAVRKVLKLVLKRFIAIDKTMHPNVKKDAPLYFFQKYCVAEIQRRIDAGERGVVLANDPGLGKTRTALVAVNGDPATIITPNSVVTTWAEEAQKALKHSDILVLQDMQSGKRKEMLRTSDATHCVTNVEFLRSTEEDDRYDLLSNDETIVVQDEAHGLLNLTTEQSKGARRLKSKFLLLLSATPCKDPRTLRRILHILEPDDERFKNDAAFTKAFPTNDPKALKTLNVMKQQYMIRFTKEDVLEEMDPNIPLSQQKHRLPRKEYVSEDQMGGYTLSEEQTQAIYELLLNFPKWSKKYDRYIPKDEIAKLDQLRGNSNALVKTHALRQTANNPSYIGANNVEDAKSKELLKCVDAFRAEGRKIVIFCQYNAQAAKYVKLLASHNPSVYTGMTSRQGYRTNAAGEELRYGQNKAGSWILDDHGLPSEEQTGKPMSALDYERIAFQNAAERDVMITTLSMGAVGVTFTAGKATIFDDLPRDCIEEIQAEDRNHRIDHEHQTHHSVKYARMIAHYPSAFLERMKKIWVKKKNDGTYEEIHEERTALRQNLETAYDTFFSQGTYDEVRLAGLKTQRTRFRLINDGIDDESELPEIKNLI